MSDRARTWCRHLREGGTTPWSDWSDWSDRSGGTGADDGARGPFLPGAQQLELLRRLNEAGRPSAVLAERVLTASAPGRGRPDLELVGAAPPRDFGPRPVDPADLPEHELLRVAAGLLAEDVVAAGLPAVPRPGWERPWRRSYRLAGDEWRTAPLREELVRRGRPPGGRRPLAVVLGADLDTLLRHAYTARAFSGGGPAWPDWLGRAAAHDTLPRRADLAAAAARWAQRVGRARVRVVLDDAAVPRVLGTRRPLPAPPEPSGAAVDLARRVAAPLGLLVLPEHRATLLRRTLLPRLLGADPSGAPLAVPARHSAWVGDRAERLHRAVLSADYPVVGSPERLRRRSVDGTAHASADVLALAVRLLLAGGEG